MEIDASSNRPRMIVSSIDFEFQSSLDGARQTGAAATSDSNGSDNFSSSGAAPAGAEARLPPISRRLHSYDDLVHAAAAAAHDAYFKRCHTTPGYVSFEDVIGSQEFEESSRRPPEAGISYPLLRATSRLYARPHPALHRRRSPGPLGTRRGGPVYRFVKRYVCPCLGFVAGIIGVKQSSLLVGSSASLSRVRLGGKTLAARAATPAHPNHLAATGARRRKAVRPVGKAAAGPRELAKLFLSAGGRSGARRWGAPAAGDGKGAADPTPLEADPARGRGDA
uniref:Uncharacterized protein n=1 Tax=Oryza rufipogon TaxID=4529 RepID=A0A0E0P8Z3_ORYRU